MPGRSSGWRGECLLSIGRSETSPSEGRATTRSPRRARPPRQRLVAVRAAAATSLPLISLQRIGKASIMARFLIAAVLVVPSSRLCVSQATMLRRASQHGPNVAPD